MKLNSIGQRVVAHNLEVVEKWINTCPKAHRLKSFAAIVEKYMSKGGVVIRNGYLWWLSFGNGNLRDIHHKWAPVEVPHSYTWQIDDEALEKHNREIHELRHNTEHRTVYSDAGSLRLEVDGACIMIPSDTGDGIHKVFFTTRELGNDSVTLSCCEAHDRLICSAKGKVIRVYKYDCGDHDSVSVWVEAFPIPQTFNIYQVTNGWKIERAIKKNEIGARSEGSAAN